MVTDVSLRGDAHKVLLAMMELSNEGEGEQPIAQVNVDAITAIPADDIFAGLGNGDISSVEKIAVTDCPKAPEVLGSTESAISDDMRDDEDESGLLDLLAGDIDQVWG